MIAGILFYLFSSILLLSAVAAVSVRPPVAAVLFLIVCFFNAAGLMLLIGAEFLAFILLIVYVGAVAVLFLFVVMMLKVDGDGASPCKGRSLLPVFLGVCGVLAAQTAALAWLWPQGVGGIVPLAALSEVDNARALGRVLYTDFALPFQGAGLILLTAMIGAIVLTEGRRKAIHRQDPRAQKARDPQEVVRLHKVEVGKGAL